MCVQLCELSSSSIQKGGAFTPTLNSILCCGDWKGHSVTVSGCLRCTQFEEMTSITGFTSKGSSPTSSECNNTDGFNVVVTKMYKFPL